MEATMLRLVFSTAPEGVEVADYDAWYEEHIRDVVAVPGFLRARRFTVHSRPGRRQPSGYSFLTIYETGPSPANISEHLQIARPYWRPDWWGRLDYASWQCVLKPGYLDPVVTDEMFLAISSPPAGVDAQIYDDWYRGHLIENSTVAGINRCWRFTMTPLGSRASTFDPLTHLALYELLAPMPVVFDQLHALRDAGGMVIPSWFDQINFGSVAVSARSAGVTNPALPVGS
jgi:hypothetical protein